METEISNSAEIDYKRLCTCRVAVVVRVVRIRIHQLLTLWRHTVVAQFRSSIGARRKRLGTVASVHHCVGFAVEVRVIVGRFVVVASRTNWWQRGPGRKLAGLAVVGVV